MNVVQQGRRRMLSGHIFNVRIVEVGGLYRIETLYVWGWFCYDNHLDNLDRQIAEQRFNKYGEAVVEA